MVSPFEAKHENCRCAFCLSWCTCLFSLLHEALSYPQKKCLLFYSSRGFKCSGESLMKYYTITAVCWLKSFTTSSPVSLRMLNGSDCSCVKVFSRRKEAQWLIDWFYNGFLIISGIRRGLLMTNTEHSINYTISKGDLWEKQSARGKGGQDAIFHWDRVLWTLG